MIRNLVLVVFLLATASHAEQRTWPVSELRARFRVTGQTFALDPSGKRVLREGGPWRTWRTRDEAGIITNTWTSEDEGKLIFGLKHTWQIQDDGSIKVHIEQYGKIKEGKPREKGPVLSDLVRQEDKVLVNLEPITWVVSKDAQQTLVVRFIPDFADEEMPKAVSYLPISGTDITIADNQGFVWADHLDTEGKYAGFTTNHGALYLSYYPFPGAKEIGSALGRTLEVRLDKKRFVTLTSLTPFLPSGMHAKVFGIADESHKTGELNRTGVSNSDKEAEFLKKIRR